MKDQLYEALLAKNIPEPLCKALVNDYLTTDYTQMRMLGYISRMTEVSEEMVIDEMIAILSDIDMWAKKKEAEHAQAVITDIINNGL